MLVVLDNCEQATVAVGTAVAVWATLAPGAFFVATSRETLKIRGERVVELRPLSLPTSGAALELAEAVQLFVERARTIGRVPSDDELVPIGQIVRALDGLPLAIELAVGRLTVLRVQELYDRLSKRLDLLTHGPRDSAVRHQTMLAAIGWSWSLLSEAEQAVLRQCAVFRGGFTLEAARRKSFSLSPIPRIRAIGSLIDVLQSLREKSLLRLLDSGATAEARLGMFESIRQFAEEELVRSGEDETTYARHAAYYVRVAALWSAELTRQAGVNAMRRVLLELHNINAAIERQLSACSVTPALADPGPCGGGCSRACVSNTRSTLRLSLDARRLVGERGWDARGTSRSRMRAPCPFLNHARVGTRRWCAGRCTSGACSGSGSGRREAGGAILLSLRPGQLLPRSGAGPQTLPRGAGDAPRREGCCFRTACALQHRGDQPGRGTSR